MTEIDPKANERNGEKTPDKDVPPIALVQGTADTHQPVQQANEQANVAETNEPGIHKIVWTWTCWFRRRIWHYIRKPTFTDWVVAIATIVIAFATWKTWKEVQQGSAQTAQMIEAANKIKEALNVSNSNYLSGLRQTLDQSQRNADIANAQNQRALDASLAEMRRQRVAMQQAAQAAIDQAQISENQASARLIFENFKWVRLPDRGATISFDVVNVGDSEATEIGEDSNDSPAAINPRKDEQLMAAGNINPNGESLEKGARKHIEFGAPNITSANRGNGTFAWYAYRKYTYLDIFQRTKEVCGLVWEHKGRFILDACPLGKRELQTKPD